MSMSPSSWISAITGRHKGKKTNSKEIHDLTSLEEITFENVLDCLVERYSMKEYYTFAGTLLISLNPCLQNSRKSLSTEQLSTQFRSYDDGVGRSPHVFSVGMKCLNSLKTVRNNQIVVVSGNSGAGKTTATQQLLRYFIEHSEKETLVRTPNGLDKKIYFATLILESLGNASTAVNPNSSRFGRFVQLNYNSNSGCIVGAQIRTCLLEKHRVSKCSTFERNFHIFYYIFVSLEKGLFSPADYVVDYDLGDDWQTLIPEYFKQNVKISDEEQFLTLYQSLMSLKMTAELEKVFSIIFGIMVLLNVHFIPLDDKSFDSTGNGDNEIGSTHPIEFTIENTRGTDVLSDVFGVESEALIDTLVARKITAGGTSRRKSIFRKPCQSIRECDERRAALACHLYDALFHHVLDRLNSMITCSTNKKQDTSTNSDINHRNQIQTISLLDLYGFEKLENNHLEQLCINYANERLQMVQILQMKTHFNEMANWDMDFKPVEMDHVIQELSERISSLHNPLFQVLNEECLLNRLGTSDRQVYERLGIATKGNKYVQTGKPHDPSCPFIVQHYAMDVKYELTGLIGKNTDNIPPEFNELFGNSSRIFLKTLIANLERRNSEDLLQTMQTPRKVNSRNKVQREKTILQRFKASVDGLMSELAAESNHDLHFIRCIRPNNELVEGKVHRQTIRQQLLSSGIVDIIRITGNGFPIRITKTKFLRDFPCITKRCFKTKDNSLELDTLLSNVFNLGELEIRFGKTQIFLTEKAWTFLQKVEAFIWRTCAVILQRSWRAFIQRRVEAAAKERAQQLSEELSQLRVCPLTEENNNPTKLELQGDPIVFAVTEQGLNNSSVVISPLEIQVQAFQKTPQPFHQRTSFASAMDKLKSVISQLNLRCGDGIVSRGRVHKGPIHIYTKKTVLDYGHVFPKRLTTRGCIEAVLDLDPQEKQILKDVGGGDADWFYD